MSELLFCRHWDAERTETITSEVTDALKEMFYLVRMREFPLALKTWRRTRRLSQLQLAMKASVSSRHISFLETGRSLPSVDMIRRLSDALSLPLATRNTLLTLAGFAAPYRSRAWDDKEMQPISAALAYMLDKHAPYPAFAVDRLWKVIRVNAPAQVLFGALGIVEGASLLDAMTSDVLPARIENWPVVAQHTAQRLRLESGAQGGVPELERVAEKLAAVGATAPWEAMGPVVPTIFRVASRRLSLFATLAQFGTPEDLALDALKIELFFPADRETDEALRA
jgi:transcriptional regulator with XRE-family HTH domain